MSMSTPRPKRHAPKKLDPDFIVDPLVQSNHLKVLSSPPKKRLSRGKTPSPGIKSENMSKVKNIPEPVNKLESKSCARSKVATDTMKTKCISRQAKSTVDCKNTVNKIKNHSLRLALDSSEKVKTKKNGRVTESLSDDFRTYKVKECEKSACKATACMCFGGCSPHCTGNGYTSRWSHLSDGEHFCNNCFEHFYRSYKDGYQEYNKWKRVWSINGQSDSNVKNFMADQKLPYWLQCNKCRKWRQISCKLKITSDFVRQYQCGQSILGIKKESNQDCESEEDERVSAVYSNQWLQTLAYPSYLQQSPAAHLMRTYHQDSVGLSPYYNSRDCMSNNAVDEHTLGSGICLDSKLPGADKETSATDQSQTDEKHESRLPSWSNPFMEYIDETETALCFCPSQMSSDEMKAFHQYHRIPQIYLAVRNLIIALWNMDCKKPVTVETCQQHLLCRGLVRIRCVNEIPHIIKFLSLHGFINTGYISHIPRELHPPKVEQLHVIVIGAGPAGISAASHLHKFGAQVTVLEAKGYLGGRCHDNMSLGVCVGEGAQIINCTENNPLSVLCDQVSAQVEIISDRCDLYQETGQVTSPALDRHIDFHFNAMLDNVAEWRKEKNVEDDTNLLDKIKEMHKEFKVESSLKFTEEEEKLLEFHCGNLEFACGASLDKISALYWDQNENYPQFSGSPGFIMDGFCAVLSRLASDLDIKYKKEVTKIDYSNDKVKVMTSDDSCYHGDRVIVTVPLAVLQGGLIEFCPPLPQNKVKAIQKLGAGQIEKVALRFSQPFWLKKTKGADCFGHVPESETVRGQFGVFYHIKSKDIDKGPFVLVTHLCGNAIQQMENKTDEEIVQQCMQTLKKLFPEENVPDPVSYMVTHWKNDPHTSMAYVYIPVGCSGDVLDDLAEMVDEKVHFAGEATNRQFPQSVTGAYFSGIREAYLILTGLELDLQTDVKDTMDRIESQNTKQQSTGER